MIFIWIFVLSNRDCSPVICQRRNQSTPPLPQVVNLKHTLHHSEVRTTPQHIQRKNWSSKLCTQLLLLLQVFCSAFSRSCFVLLSSLYTKRSYYFFPLWQWCFTILHPRSCDVVITERRLKKEPKIGYISTVLQGDMSSLCPHLEMTGHKPTLIQFSSG